MTAPSNAYVIKDGQFLKVMTRKSSSIYPCYVARFLSGTSAQGGYATTSATMKERIKSLFHLDELADLREKQADGTTKSVGFVGLVNPSGSNAKYHNLTTRGAGLAHREGAVPLEHMNDAGLNTLADAAIDAVRSSFANVIVLDVSVTSAFYLMTDKVVWTLKTVGGNAIMQYELGSVAKRTSKAFRPGYWDASLNPTQQVVSGQALTMEMSVQNAEGTLVRSVLLTTKARVLWEASQGRPQWRYSTAEPSYMRQMTSAAVAMVDLYEADIDKFDYLPGSSSGVAAQAPKFYAGVSADWPSMSSPAAAGWYFCAALALYTEKEEWGARAVYVDSTGTAKYYKDLPDPRTQLVLGMKLTNAATETDRPNDTYRTIELYARVSGGWYEQYPKIRVRVGVYGTNIPVSADATVITDRDGNVIPHKTNITGLNINVELTQQNSQYSKVVTQAYKTQALMNQYGGSRYYDCGTGVYYKLDQDPSHWSVVCLGADGSEHEFEGDITWYGGGVGAEVSKPAQ